MNYPTLSTEAFDKSLTAIPVQIVPSV